MFTKLKFLDCDLPNRCPPAVVCPPQQLDHLPAHLGPRLHGPLIVAAAVAAAVAVVVRQLYAVWHGADEAADIDVEVIGLLCSVKFQVILLISGKQLDMDKPSGH